MVFKRHHQPRLKYLEYKKLGDDIYAQLDPDGQLNRGKTDRAKRIVPDLVRRLPKEQDDTVNEKLEKAIKLRKECAGYYLFKPRWSRMFHEMYIEFLEHIKEQLSVHSNDEEPLRAMDAAVDDTKKQPVVNVTEQQQPEEDAQLSEEEVNWANEARSEHDPEPDNEELDQIDFLAFLEIRMGLVRRAAAFWTEVAQDKLPIWGATNLSGILLREADNLVNVTRMLDEESKRGQRKSKASVPWAAATISKDGGGVSKPQLTQDWVDALDKAGDAAAPWRELVNYLPSLSSLLETLVFPCITAAPNTDRPYFATMLLADAKALARDDKHPLPSPARVPFATLVGVYFCKLVVGDLAVRGTAALQLYPEFLATSRDAACATLAEILAVLPRLVAHRALVEEEADIHREMAAEMMAGANACANLMSLGQIFLMTRMNWVQTHGFLTAGNSLPLQAFLYLCEKRRGEVRESSNMDFCFPMLGHWESSHTSSLKNRPLRQWVVVV